MGDESLRHEIQFLLEGGLKTEVFPRADTQEEVQAIIGRLVRGQEILALNLVSSPGSGKTTLLERIIRDLKSELKLYVIEDDQATANDGERIVPLAPAVQLYRAVDKPLPSE
jgi:predicted ATP-dependent serine protease